MNVSKAGFNMDEQLLVVVPPSTYYEDGDLAAFKSITRRVPYNVASWLCLPGARGRQLKLVLQYVDSNGRHRMVVDHGITNEQSRVLLTGRPTLELRGRITEMELYVLGVPSSETLKVEELFVQRVDELKALDRSA